MTCRCMTASILEGMRRPMPFRAGVAAALIFGFGMDTSVRAQAPLPPGKGPVTVTGPIRVIEADTLEVSIDGRRVGIGLVGIKAPAGNTACGRQAIAALYALLEEGVELRDDGRAAPYDRRTRRKVKVALPRSRGSLAVALARAGVVRADPEDIDGEEYADILDAEVDARTNRRGCVH